MTSHRTFKAPESNIRVTLLLLATMFLAGMMSRCDGQPCDTHTCVLPSCYCQYKESPLFPREFPPQIVHFTYTGKVSEKEREYIGEIFSKSTQNPNGCSVGITIFVIGENSEDCAIHMLYSRGHEIALAGMNITGTAPPTDGNVTRNFTLANQRSYLVEHSYIAKGHIVGMRVQKQNPQGDTQFHELYESDFAYDSSLHAGPNDKFPQKPYPWPFTLDSNFTALGFECRYADQNQCPSEEYPGFWEIPHTALRVENRTCAVLDNCIVGLNKQEVADFLVERFERLYRGRRAPMQINLLPKSLENKKTREGIKLFLSHVTEYEDAWIVTMQETLAWMADPTSLDKVMNSGVWDCYPKRYYNKTCDMSANKTTVSVTLREVIDVDKIWIWQTVILIVLYIVIVRYDRMKQAEKKK